MSLLDRYLMGNCIEVYEEINSLGEEAFQPTYFPQVDLVLKETFRRVSYNLAIIYSELKDIDYLFKSNIRYDWERPLLQPHSDTDSMLSAIKQKVSTAGHLPLSLEYFYKIVGSCNFCWDWETNPEIPWEGADPIDIPPVKELLELIYDGYDNKDILLTGDYLQKDNVSGSCYNIELTSGPSVDSLLLHKDWDIPFIEYLRITFKNCGFSMADVYEYKDLDNFIERVRPWLKDI